MLVGLEDLEVVEDLDVVEVGQGEPFVCLHLVLDLNFVLRQKYYPFLKNTSILQQAQIQILARFQYQCTRQNSSVFF